MGNSLRCCLACVLPCGALDLIRIVHLNGYVEEITRPVTAGEILMANPNHILSKPCSQGVVRKIMILSPDSELKRGSIYFLIPDSSLPEKKKNKKKMMMMKKNQKGSNMAAPHKKAKKQGDHINKTEINGNDSAYCAEKYLEDVKITEKKSSGRDNHHHHHRRRHSRSASVSLWQPHLESISEDN